MKRKEWRDPKRQQWTAPKYAYMKEYDSYQRWLDSLVPPVWRATAADDWSKPWIGPDGYIQIAPIELGTTGLTGADK